MPRRSADRYGRVLILLAVAIAACSSDDNFQPSDGSLQIAAATTGDDPDPDGYVVQVDGSERGPVAASGELGVAGLTAGDHEVGLNGVAGNCLVEGDNPRAVSVVAGQTTAVAFTITCAAPLPSPGSIHIVTTTLGSNPDPDGYSFAVDGGAAQPIGVDATTTLTNVAAGAHSVELSGMAQNCSIEGSNPELITVPPGGTAEVSFRVACS